MEHEAMWNKVMELAEQAPRPSAGQELFLFGGGLSGALTIPLLKSELELVAVCDNDPQKQGTQIEGLPCVSPQALEEYGNPFVLISSCKHLQSISKELLTKNIPHCSLDAYVIRQNRAAFQEVYQGLDDESRRVYAGVLYCRLTDNEAGVEKYCSDNQYFCLPKFRYFGMRDTLIDCGAFAGDVVEKAVDNSIGLFRRIYAFEPCKRAYTALQKRTAFLKEIWALDEGQIVCEQKGVGAGNYYADFRANAANLGNMSISVTEHDQEGVEIVSLDDYLTQHHVERVTMIKADIEGAEWDMLHGAEETIRRDKPNLAVSIYHSIFDYFRIFNYLKELVPEYTFAVRHHWNSFDETVLYCYLQ